MELRDFFINLVISIPLTAGQAVDTTTGGLKPNFGATFIPTYATPRRLLSNRNESTMQEQEMPHQVTPTAIGVKTPFIDQPTTFKKNNDNSSGSPPPLPQNALMSKPYYFPTEMKPPLMLEQIPLATFQTIKFSNMFQGASLGSQPGMLIEGSGIDLMGPYPVSNFTRVYEEHLPNPVYIGYPGMIGSNEQLKLQTQTNGLSSLYGRLSDGTNALKQDLSMYENIKPIDNYSTNDAFDMSNQSNGNNTELFAGNQTSLNEAIHTIEPILSGYQWHGEWPGKSESEKNQDWSSGWADTRSNKDDEGKSSTGHEATQILANDADKGVDLGFMISAIDGSPKVDHAIQSNTDKLDNMQQTLDTFQQFLSFLRNAGALLGQKRGNTEDSTYNDLAKGWAKDLHA